MLAPWHFGSACLGGRNARITVECLNLLHRGGVIPLGLYAPCSMHHTCPSAGVRRFFEEVSHEAPSTHKKDMAFLFCPVEFCHRTMAKDIQPGQRLFHYSHLM